MTASVRTADPARRAAYDTLRAVEDRDAYANLTLPGLLRERRISGRDAAFATELAYGALRGRGTYDQIIAACSSRPLADIDPQVADALRLGAHQLLKTRVPAHAAVSSTVDLSAMSAGPQTTGFVNAVLRKIASRDFNSWITELAPAYADDPVGHIALAHMHPRWIVEVFSDALGGDLDETARACAANNVAPPVHLVARPGGIDTVSLLAAAGPDARPGRWSPHAVVMAGGDPGDLTAVRDGRAAVQDEGSQLAALAMLASDVDGPESKWLDMCAGPGGKAALLAAHAAGSGVHILASDRSVHRARLTAQTIGADLPAYVITADGTRPAWRNESFDRALIDAPCTGLGALRRRPEARWRRVRADADGLHSLQVNLLRAGIAAVRPGGVVAYVTCSPDRRETEAVVNEVLETDPVEGISVSLPVVIPGIERAERTGAIQLWPQRHDTDAMYVAVLRRLHGSDYTSGRFQPGW
ncbi:MAG: rRNA (cytosine967-C5)-methyltransferase [Frankiales bacterium]|jgi:16S rRNA (cytosine967-C5)-methyltransferase|nr:rRNA (cytosine967-C5)-methyltransferase [Frankiales bacterium]